METNLETNKGIQPLALMLTCPQGLWRGVGVQGFTLFVGPYA